MTTKIDRLNKKLQEVKDAFDMWQNVGLDEEILIIYIMQKTRIGKKTIEKVLHNQKEFFDKLVKEEVMDKLDNAGYKRIAKPAIGRL